jgi:hypothetical protein
MSTNDRTGSFDSLRSHRGRWSSVFQFWRGLGYKTCVKNLMEHEFSGVCVCVCVCVCMYVCM